MSASAILCGLAAELGDILPISDLAGPAPHHEQISELEEMGLRTFSCMVEGVLDAVTRCVASTLDSAQLLPQEIKAVMFVTEAFTALSDSCPHGGESLIRFHRNASLCVSTGYPQALLDGWILQSLSPEMVSLRAF